MIKPNHTRIQSRVSFSALEASRRACHQPQEPQWRSAALDRFSHGCVYGHASCSDYRIIARFSTYPWFPLFVSCFKTCRVRNSLSVQYGTNSTGRRLWYTAMVGEGSFSVCLVGFERVSACLPVCPSVLTAVPLFDCLLMCSSCLCVPSGGSQRDTRPISSRFSQLRHPVGLPRPLLTRTFCKTALLVPKGGQLAKLTYRTVGP